MKKIGLFIIFFQLISSNTQIFAQEKTKIKIERAGFFEKDKVKLTNFKTKFDGIKLFFIPINIKIDREQEFNNLITDYVTNHKRNC